MSELNPFQPGAQLGRYEIVRPLGKGGMGQVYLARDGMLQREVVIKTLSREVSDQAVLERWRREILTMARVNHPNVISIYDAEFGSGALGLSYIVMEYAALGSLQDELEHLQGRATMMAVAQVLEIGIQVAQALCAVHGAGVIHRDIKPSNILITRTPEGRVIYKLADFGIAIASDLPRVTSTHSSLLTPLFAAPEQFASSKVDERADIYSLGATLWDCLARPSGSLDRVRTSANLGSPLPLITDYRRDVPTSLQQLIARATAPKPSDRFQSAAELLSALQAAQNDLTAQFAATTQQTATTQGGAIAAPARLGKRTPILVPALTAVGLVAAAGIVFGVFLRPQARPEAPAVAPGQQIAQPPSPTQPVKSGAPQPSTPADLQPSPAQGQVSQASPASASIEGQRSASDAAPGSAEQAAKSRQFPAFVPPRIDATPASDEVATSVNLQLVLAGTENQAWIFGYAGESPQFFQVDSSGTLAKLEVPGSIFRDYDARIKDGIVSSSGELVVLNSQNVWAFSEGAWKPLLDAQSLFGSVKYSLQRFILLPGGNVIVLGEWQDVGLDSSRAVLIPWSEGKPELPIPLDIKFYDFASLRSKSEFWVIEGNGFSFYKEGSKLLSVRCKDMYFGIRALYPDLSDDNTAYAVEYSDLWKFEEGSCFNLSYNVEILKDIEAHKMFIEVFSRDRLWLLSRGGVLISLEGQNWRRQRITPLAVTLNHLRVFSDQLAWAVGDNGVVIRYANGEWTTVHPRR